MLFGRVALCFILACILSQSANAAGTVIALPDAKSSPGSKILVEYDLSDPVKKGMRVRLGYRDPNTRRFAWNAEGIVLDAKMVSSKGQAVVQIESASEDIEEGWTAVFVLGTAAPTPVTLMPEKTPENAEDASQETELAAEPTPAAQDPTVSLPETVETPDEQPEVQEPTPDTPKMMWRRVPFVKDAAEEMGYGSILLESDMPVRAILDGGLDLGIVPVEVYAVPPGEHTVQVELAGYETGTMYVAVEANKRTRLKLSVPAKAAPNTPVQSILAPTPTPAALSPVDPSPPTTLRVPAVHVLAKQKHSCSGWLKMDQQSIVFEPSAEVPTQKISTPKLENLAGQNHAELTLHSGELKPPMPPSSGIQGGEFEIKIKKDAHVFYTPFTKRNSDFWNFVQANRLPAGFTTRISAALFNLVRQEANPESAKRQEILQRLGKLEAWGIEENTILLNPKDFSLQEEPKAGCPWADQACFRSGARTSLGAPSSAKVKIQDPQRIMYRDPTPTGDGSALLYVLPQSLKADEKLILEEIFSSGVILRTEWAADQKTRPNHAELEISR